MLKNLVYALEDWGPGVKDYLLKNYVFSTKQVQEAITEALEADGVSERDMQCKT